MLGFYSYFVIRVCLILVSLGGLDVVCLCAFAVLGLVFDCAGCLAGVTLFVLVFSCSVVWGRRVCLCWLWLFAFVFLYVGCCLLLFCYLCLGSTVC